MKNNKFNQLTISKILLLIFLFSLVIICSFYFIDKNDFNKSTSLFEDIEYINSGVQRIAKLELENNYSDDLITELKTIVFNINEYSKDLEYFSPQDNEKIKDGINLLIESFNLFVESISYYRTEGDRLLLFSNSEKNYDISETLVNDYKFALDELSKDIDSFSMLIIYNVIIIALILIKMLIDTINELKKNRELSKEMFIDTSTGLYNRSKCQEILNTSNGDDIKERAIIIFDLNDLKKTNDLHGHRAGDDLISCFAQQLKNATLIFKEEVFAGRYGGDEFMVYFNSAEVKDVELYLKEVDFLINEFNETQNKPFKLSCAAGYSITTPETKTMKIREIFDEADENMYKNKIAMKEKKRQEMMDKGIQLEEHHDDRLG